MKGRIFAVLFAVSGSLLANNWSTDSLTEEISMTSPKALKAVSSLNGTWKVSTPQKSHIRPTLSAAENTGYWKPNVSTASWHAIKVPHYSWHKYFPQTYPDPKKPFAMYQFSSPKPTYVQGWFGREFTVPASLKGTRIHLDFGGIAWESHIWVNGQKAGSHKGSFTGFQLDVTKLIKYDQPNILRIWVYNDFGERPPRHTYGKMFFASSNYGGITGGVKLVALPPVNVSRCLINPSINQQQVNLELTVNNDSGQTADSNAFVVMSGGRYPDFNDTKIYPLGRVSLKKGVNQLSYNFKMSSPVLWSPENPYLYQTFVIFKEAGTGKIICSYRNRFGFREFHQKGDKFFLNGKRIRLYCGNILSSGSWERFAPDNHKSRKNLRRQKQQGANTIRYHMAGTDSHWMLAMADEEGLLVISEFPMFHRIFHDLAFPDKISRQEFMDNVLHEWRERLYRDYNHPSCVIWSLSNEVWSDSTVDELNEIYTELKPLDKQRRPMSADSGIHSFGIPTIPVKTDFWDAHLYNLVSKIPYTFAQVDFDRYFDDLKKIYGRLDRPSAAFECLHIGYGKPSQVISFEQNIPVEKYLKLTKANPCEDKNYLGLRHFLAWRNNGNFILDNISKKAVEQFRFETRIQGFHPWWRRRNQICPSYKIITAPIFVGAKLLPKHQFAGRNFSFKATVIKDSLKLHRVELNAEIIPTSAGQAAVTRKVAVMLPKNQDKTIIPISLPLPTSMKTGFYQLVLTIRNNGKKLCRNEYEIYIQNRADLPKLTMARGKVAVFEPGKPNLINVLKINNVSFTRIDNFRELKKFSHLILHVSSSPGWKKVLSNGGAIREWVKNGGRLLLLEVPFSVSLDWIMQGYSIRKDANGFETTSLIMEPVLRGHPLFKGLSVNHFDTLNDSHGVVGNALIYPLNRNLIATGFPCSRKGPGGLVYEAKLKRGSCLLSQPHVLKRYDSDSVATLYLHNLLLYFSDHNVYSKVKPLAANQDAGVKKAIKAVNGSECEPIDLRNVVNRGFRDKVAGDGKGGWTDAGVNDFRNAPTGSNTFLGIPFEIIDPAHNNDKAAIILKGQKCPSFPEQVCIENINKRYRRLFFLQMAWYLNIGKPLMEYTVRYQDGTKTTRPVVGGVDIGDWYAPSDLKNAPAVWSRKHPVISAPFGFYLMMWENPFPSKTIKTLELKSAGLSVPIVLAVSGQKYVEYGSSVLRDAWSFTSGDDIKKSFGVKPLGVKGKKYRFEMTRSHSWLALNARDTVIDAKLWKRLSFSLKSTSPLRVKVLYFSPTGDNGTCDWLKPVRQSGGWSYYDVLLDQVRWRHGSSPAAKQWGGRKHTVSMFAIDLYSLAGAKVELGPVKLFKD